jgi:hypothetical protein
MIKSNKKDLKMMRNEWRRGGEGVNDQTNVNKNLKAGDSEMMVGNNEWRRKKG